MVRAATALLALAMLLPAVRPLDAAEPRSGRTLEPARLACERLSVEYAAAIDGNDPEALAALFTVDGRWQTGAQPLAGRAAIAGYLKDFVARKTVTSLHVTSNVRVRMLDDTHAEGTAYVTIYGIAKGGPIGLPRGVGIYHDRFARTAEGWLFAERLLEHVSQ